MVFPLPYTNSVLFVCQICWQPSWHFGSHSSNLAGWENRWLIGYFWGMKSYPVILGIISPKKPWKIRIPSFFFNNQDDFPGSSIRDPQFRLFFLNIRINIRVVKKHHFYHPGFFRGLVRELHQNPQGFRSIDSFHPTFPASGCDDFPENNQDATCCILEGPTQCTVQGTNISPKNGILKIIFPFPTVGYVNSLEGICICFWLFLFGKLLSFPLAKFNMVHLKIITLKRKLSFDSIIFGFHVDHGECMECIETCCAKKSLGLSHVWRKGSRYRSGFLAGVGWLMSFHIHPRNLT